RPNALAFSRDGATLAAGDDNGQITLWDLKSGEARELNGHEDAVTRLVYLPEGPLVSSSLDHTVRVWDPEKPGEPSILHGHVDSVLSLARVADHSDRTLGLISGDSNRGEVRYWQLVDGNWLS